MDAASEAPAFEGNATKPTVIRSSSDVLGTSAIIYFPIFLVSWLVYEFFRTRRPHVYEHENHCNMQRRERLKWFRWIPFVMNVSDSTIVNKCGLDAWVFFRFVRFGQKVAGLVILCSLVLFPLFLSSAPMLPDDGSAPSSSSSSSPSPATQVAAAALRADVLPDVLPVVPFMDNSAPSGEELRSFWDRQRVHVDLIDRLSIANVMTNNWRLYGSLVVMYVMSIYVMYLLVDEYQEYVKRRHQFLSRLAAQQYSVVVTDLPIALRRPQTLMTYMEYLFPDSVHSVYIGVECARLEELLEERNTAKYRLESAVADLEDRERSYQEMIKNGIMAADTPVPRPDHVIHRRFFGLCGRGERVDTIDHFRRECDRLNQEILDERKSIVRRQFDLTKQPHGFYGSFEAPTKWPSLRNLENQLSAMQVPAPLKRTLGLNVAETSVDPSESEPLVKSEGSQISKKVQESVDQKQDDTVMRSSAFVSFRSLRMAHAAQQLLQTQNPVKLRILPAPHIKDIVWENFGLPHHLKVSWGLFAALSTFLIVCFWTIPTAFVTSLANVEKLRHTSVFWEQAIDTYPWIQKGLEQAAPLILVSMNGLANVIFKILATREGHLSLTEVDASLFSKLCYFQVFQMFFVSAVTGSVLAQMMAMVDQPKRVLFFLGSSIASQSTLFITFIIVQICVDLPMMLLRVLPLAKDIFHKMFAPTYAKIPERLPWMGLYPLNYASDMDSAYFLAQQFLIFLLVIVFAPIAPLVAYFGAFFFLCSELVYKRYYLFVTQSRWSTVNSMGSFWPSLFSFIVGALIIAQLTLIGLLSLKAADYIALLIAMALPFGTFLFHVYVTTLYGFPKAAANLPLDQCCDLDEERKEESFDFLDGVYQQPAMIKAYTLPVLSSEAGSVAHIDSTNSSAVERSQIIVDVDEDGPSSQMHSKAA
ncbi:TPA: hypothetical protein N0F65_011230 [Lagenidium giganteum]|uniref:Calcium permeable stress-gated cation channel 1 n=1 Tax=Lagenidium giganteum TaxID=4803 RepID=A0AAV2YT63_9STRA|nr:TPA: hypothetical protein N0F65_011230 [Lagenidium giganteum]